MSAFAYCEYALTCDHDGCRTAYGPFGVERTRAHLRKLAARDGWTVNVGDGPLPDREDFCPDHKPAKEADR